MMTVFENRLRLVLFVLLGLTLLSWGVQTVSFPEPKWAGLAVLAIAFVKVRLIVVHYMEAKLALLPIRVAFELWVWGTAAMVLALY